MSLKDTQSDWQNLIGFICLARLLRWISFIVADSKGSAHQRGAQHRQMSFFLYNELEVGPLVGKLKPNRYGAFTETDKSILITIKRQFTNYFKSRRKKWTAAQKLNLLHLNCECRCLWDLLSIKMAPHLFVALHSYFPDTKDYTVCVKDQLWLRSGSCLTRSMASRLRGETENILCMHGSCSDDMHLTLKLICINCICVLPSPLIYREEYIVKWLTDVSF